VLGLGTASAALIASCTRPVEKAIPYFKQYIAAKGKLSQTVSTMLMYCYLVTGQLNEARRFYQGNQQKDSPFHISMVEAPHFRRVAD